MHIGIVHTLGGGIIAAVDERVAWLNRYGPRIRTTLIAPEKRRRRPAQSGVFFPVSAELPSTYQRDYEQAVVSELIPALLIAHAAKPFDLLDAHDGTALIGCHEICRQFDIPLMHTIHSHEILERFACGPSEELQAALRRTSTFVAVSDHIGQAHAKVLGRVPITIRNPVPRYVSQRLPRRPLSVVRAVFLGRVEAMKGFDLLLDAVEQLDRRSKLTITAIGSLEEEELAVRARTSTLSINLCGKIDVQEALYASLAEYDLLVFPSRKEACSMALLEAMGTGLAVLCSNIPPNVEIAEDAAMYHRDGDASDLAACLQKLIESPSMLDNFASNALARARRFAPEVVFEALLDIYSSAGMSAQAFVLTDK